LIDCRVHPIGIEQGLGETDGNVTQPFTLTPNIIQIFDTLRGLEDDVVSIANEFGVQLNCANTSAVYEPFRQNFCENFVGSLALNTAMYLLAALCMCPGVFIGIRGYKRFNPHNTMDGDDDDGENMDHDDPNGSRRGSVEGHHNHGPRSGGRYRSKSADMDGIQLQNMKNNGGSVAEGLVLHQQPSSASLQASPSNNNDHISTPADPHAPPSYAHDAQFVPVQAVYYDGNAGNGAPGGAAVPQHEPLTFTPIAQ
jgi:hypothetical protein